MAVASGRFSRRIWDAMHRSCPSLVGDGRKMQIDSEWLAAFDEALLALFAIDHADAGMDREELGWYCEMPAGEAAVAYGEDFDLCRRDRVWPVWGLRLVS